MTSPKPRTVLLTGATGFLGAFLLRELLDATDAEVRCLVRADSEATARRRLREAMTHYLLWSPEVEARATPVAGDLAKPSLGLDAATWARLAEDVDVIHHNGARVSHVAPYERLHAPNVRGTAEILKLAGEGRSPKPVHFVSTGGFPSDPADPEESAEDVEHAVSGYTFSKWAAERLVHEAGRAGVPVRVYRPARISGDSHTGSCQLSDAVWIFVRAVVLLRAAPDVVPPLPEMSFAPADYVARAIVRMSVAHPADGAVRYVVNRSRMPLRTMLDVVADRFPLTYVPVDTWLGMLDGAGDDPALTKARMLLPGYRKLLAGAMPLPDWDDQPTLDDLRGTGIDCPPLDRRLLETYLDYFQSAGFLPGADRERRVS